MDFSRNCLPMDDHSYLPSMMSSQFGGRKWPFTLPGWQNVVGPFCSQCDNLQNQSRVGKGRSTAVSLGSSRCWGQRQPVQPHPGLDCDGHGINSIRLLSRWGYFASLQVRRMCGRSSLGRRRDVSYRLK